MVAVAGSKGFTPWSKIPSKCCIAGAQVRRLDLLENTELPEGTSGLFSGTLWPAILPDIAMNTPLLKAMRERIRDGLPTLALAEVC
jgi:hypothetical protein